jgi:DNA-binding NtrC family response regulator
MSSHPQRSKRTVISVGGLPELLWLRHSVLQSAGYEVLTFTDAKAAAARIANGGCGVLLLCYSVFQQSRDHLIQEFREHCPEGRIVAITNRPVAERPKEADELVYGVDGPEILIDAVRGKAAST